MLLILQWRTRGYSAAAAAAANGYAFVMSQLIYTANAGGDIGLWLLRLRPLSLILASHMNDDPGTGCRNMFLMDARHAWLACNLTGLRVRNELCTGPRNLGFTYVHAIRLRRLYNISLAREPTYTMVKPTYTLSFVVTRGLQEAVGASVTRPRPCLLYAYSCIYIGGHAIFIMLNSLCASSAVDNQCRQRLACNPWLSLLILVCFVIL